MVSFKEQQVLKPPVLGCSRRAGEGGLLRVPEDTELTAAFVLLQHPDFNLDFHRPSDKHRPLKPLSAERCRPSMGADFFGDVFGGLLPLCNTPSTNPHTLLVPGNPPKKQVNLFQVMLTPPP